MTVDDIDTLLAALPGCRPRTTGGRRGWFVEGRVVAREDAPGTLMIRADFAERERLLRDHPDTFGVPPRWERHQKVQAVLDGDARAIEQALVLAYRLQHDAR